MGEASATKKVGFFKGVKGEFRKIIWPNFSTLSKQTTTVIVVSLVIGGIIAGIDLVFNKGIFYLINNL
jgi:preprotein translocase subunit SecE